MQLFWHSFDLALARYSGRRAPEPLPADPVAREAYSHEVIAFGFWAGDARVEAPTYYTYTAPEPPGLAAHALRPDGAAWVASGAGHLGAVPYETIRTAAEPAAALTDFLRAGYDAGVNAAGWDAAALRHARLGRGCKSADVVGQRPERRRAPVRGQQHRLGSRAHGLLAEVREQLGPALAEGGRDLLCATKTLLVTAPAFIDHAGPVPRQAGGQQRGSARKTGFDCQPRLKKLPESEAQLAYEVIKRVSGRAYRYRVESFRDPETRRVRGRWTYLGRVDPADAGLPERPPKPSSRDRLLDAVARLLASGDAESLSAGSIAREAGVAYGTFYRYFTDRGNAVREALLRHGPTMGDVQATFGAPIGKPDDERARISAWLRANADDARMRRGVVRAWHVYSNADEAVVKARRAAVDDAVECVARYLDALGAAGVASTSSARFAAYAIVALAVALGRDAAIEDDMAAEKIEGITTLAWELCGLSPSGWPRRYAVTAACVRSAAASFSRMSATWPFTVPSPMCSRWPISRCRRRRRSAAKSRSRAASGATRRARRALRRAAAARRARRVRRSTRRPPRPSGSRRRRRSHRTT